MWSDKTRHHLTSFHERIWDIIEFGAQAPQVGDEDYDSNEAAQVRYFNSQATSILLASLCREEYNKVQGLKSAKEIWHVLKTAHEGDEVTKINKRETIEEELGRFVLNKGEEPQVMYNWLKTMVNQVHNLGSTKWDDHEMVKVILRCLVFRNPNQVQLIRENPSYKQMSPKEVIGKLMSFELMVKDSKHIVNLEQGATSTPEVQPIALRQQKKRRKSLHQPIGSQLMPPSLTMRR
jgi:tRNA uridine 5-carbamoylmethylation protein Kti12